MNKASSWRATLAREIAAQYCANSKVEAVAVLGSVAQGVADHASDLGLGVKMVRTHLRFRPSSEHKAWAERHELLLLYQSFCTTQKQLLLALLGLNHVYYPGLARLDLLMERLPLAPVHLATRCQQLFGIAGVDPLAGVYQLHDLIEETFALVETHLPEIDTRRARHFAFALPNT